VRKNDATQAERRREEEDIFAVPQRGGSKWVVNIKVK